MVTSRKPKPAEPSSISEAALHVDMRALKGTHVPNLGRASLKFKPKAFMVESPKLDGRIVEASHQRQCYEQFKVNPLLPMTYVCAGNPDDVKARFFAAHLAGLHARYMLMMQRTPRVLWEQLYGGFDNPAMRHEDLSMLVIDNLSAIPNKVKYDKARDLIARFPRIPKVLIVGGEDPVSFAATRLFVPAHGIVYFPSSLVRTTTVII